ncbi:hypothetical protein CSB09_04270 [Candidatus Gracilibacteria bacterium]|nr:MAG: hypothetical protein CSB09_04270 [Candidatus Gracilibacteria bacterium]
MSMADTKNVIPTTDGVGTGVDTGNEGNINKKKIKQSTGKKAGKLMIAVATAAALTAAQPTMANEANQTMVINGQTYTMEQIEENESLWDSMTEGQQQKLMAYMDKSINTLDTSINTLDTSINTLDTSIKKENQKQEQAREMTEKMTAVQAIMEIISGKRTLTNAEMTAAFHGIAVDASLSLTPSERVIFADLASSYTNGGDGPLFVSDKAKKAFKNYATEIRNELTKDEEAMRPGLDLVLQVL